MAVGSVAFEPPARSATEAALQQRHAIGRNCWGAARGWPAPEPPNDLSVELTGGEGEFLEDNWLFRPRGDGHLQVQAQDQNSEGRSAVTSSSPSTFVAPGGSQPRVVAPASTVSPTSTTSAAAAPIKAPENEPLVQFDFQYLHSFAAKDLIRVLLHPYQSASPGDTLARCFGRALERYAAKAFNLLTQTDPTGRNGIYESERGQLLNEAARAIERLVGEKKLNIANDLVFCLEAFGVSRGRPRHEQRWQTECLAHAIETAVKAATEVDFDKWRETLLSRIKDYDGELYGCVDVRAWPDIVRLLRVSHNDVNVEALKSQVRLQLCMNAELPAWRDGLEQAAELVGSMRKVDIFEIDEICEIFNDRRHFDWHFRERVLTKLLEKAPRKITAEVLKKMDDDVDIGERDDDELVLVKDLLKVLNQDVRHCRNVWFKMKSDWLVGRWSGVVFNQELSPEQICDHIEDDRENAYEDLLKIAVNHYRNAKLTSEAARLLARPACANTKVLQNNRNDKQLAYLISLYAELQSPPDRLAPIEEGCLTLPTSAVLKIEDGGENLNQLERDTLGVGDDIPSGLILGVWWFWRCFDPKLDHWSRASFLAFYYNETWAIVDFEKLEEAGLEVECRAKEIVGKILEAPHILKVTHDIDRWSLAVLQRALVPSIKFDQDEPLCYTGVTPCVDLAVVLALVRRTRPFDFTKVRLSAAVFEYLRVELCLAELLSNFERRPLRKTQIHYALTLAWVPVVILRALCAYGILAHQQLLSMAIRTGPDHVLPEKWDELLRRIRFCSPEQSDGNEMPIDREYGKNLWLDPEWVKQLPRPDPRFDIGAHLKESSAAQLLLSAQEVERVKPSILKLFDMNTITDMLQRVYEAYEARQDALADDGAAR